MGLLSCSYQMHIPASQTATPPLDLPYLIPESHYSWSPRAYDTAGNTANPGARGQFTIDREVPAVPILQSPAPGWRTNQLFPLFTWSNPGFESESDPTQTLQVCVPQGMGYQIAHSQSLGGAAWGGAATLVPNQVLPEGTLSWRVIVTDRAGNSAASAGDCAGSRSLILDRTPPRAPTIISPVNGSVVLANTPITWTREIGATGYRYYMWNQANGQWLNPGCGSVPDPGTGVVVTVTPCVSFPSGTTLIRVESIEQLDDGKNVSPLSDAVSVSRP